MDLTKYAELLDQTFPRGLPEGVPHIGILRSVLWGMRCAGLLDGVTDYEVREFVGGMRQAIEFVKLDPYRPQSPHWRN